MKKMKKMKNEMYKNYGHIVNWQHEIPRCDQTNVIQISEMMKINVELFYFL